ncbi:MAG: efflux RND transporter periplasmic adaptor subunit [Terriglobales bacterium]
MSWIHRRSSWLTVAGALAAILAVAGLALPRTAHAASRKVPTAVALQGQFLVIVTAHGALVARKSVNLAAPRVPGLTITWLAAPGSHVKPGDPVVRFDASSTKADYKAKLAAQDQATATVRQTEAQAKITAQTDALTEAEDTAAVQTAKLTVIKDSILGEIQGDEAKIALHTAEETLKVQQARSHLDATSNVAKIAGAKRLLAQAAFLTNLDRQYLAHMVLRTPSAGIVTLMMNRSGGWMAEQPFQVGDAVWPGAVIAQIPDLHSIAMEGQLKELDRGRVAVGQPVRIHVDSLPEHAIAGRLVALSQLTEVDFNGGWPPKRNFHAWGQPAGFNPQLRPGMNGSLSIVVQEIPNAISIPAEALFTLNNRPVVYVQGNGSFQPEIVKVLARNPGSIAVSGIPSGARVALANPAHSAGK